MQGKDKNDTISRIMDIKEWNMKKKIILFSVIFILSAALAYAYSNIPVLQEKLVSAMDEDFKPENIYSDLESVSKRLDEEILNGADSFIIYLKDMDVDEINQINASLDGIFGSGETYQQIGVVGDTYKKVEITIKRTSNYYAYCAYVNQIPIPESETKAKELYVAMKQILDSRILSSMSDYEKELALHDYVVTHCKYSEITTQSPESDIYRAYGALVNGDAVCNGYAEALQLLFTCAGLNSQFVVGTADGIDHAWNLVELDGMWYHVDATWNDPIPDQGESTVHPYFNVTDEIMEESHEWEKEKYPVANDMAYNYYVKSESYFTSFDDYKLQAYDTMVENGIEHYEAVIENYVENEDDMQFIFQNNYRYNSVSWQTFEEGSYHVLVMNAE